MAKENNNKSFVLRIDAATMDALELWAADEFRSIKGRDFPPAPAAVSPAAAAAPPADVASGEGTPPLQDAVPPVAAAAAGEAGPLPPHARMQSDDPQKNKADIKK